MLTGRILLNIYYIYHPHNISYKLASKFLDRLGTNFYIFHHFESFLVASQINTNISRACNFCGSSLSYLAFLRKEFGFYTPSSNHQTLPHNFLIHNGE